MPDARGRPTNHAINALRTAAAVAVVLGHARILLFQDWDKVPHAALNRFLYGATAIGHQAVIVFFVLSGYWVGGAVLRATREDRFSWSDYLTSRLVRLWIVLLPALALTAACDLLGRALFPDASVYNHVPGYAGVVTADPMRLDGVTLLGNATFQMPFKVPTYGSNTALWSLGYEFWFYILFPLLACAWLRRRRPAPAILFGVLTVAAAALAGSSILEYFPIWLVGAAIAWKVSTIRAALDQMRQRALSLLRLAAALALLLTSIVVRGVNSLPVALGDYIVAVPAAALLILLVRDLRSRPRWVSRSLHLVSRYADSSYSLYAIHVPLLVLLAAALHLEVSSRWPVDVSHAVAYVAVIAAVLVLGWLFARATEHRTDRVRAAVKRAVRSRARV